jgi:hypothetical protein
MTPRETIEVATTGAQLFLRWGAESSASLAQVARVTAGSRRLSTLALAQRSEIDDDGGDLDSRRIPYVFAGQPTLVSVD